MFKQGSVEEELYRSMEKSLVALQVEEQHGFDKLARATELLHTAATIFDQAGMISESNAIVEILQSWAKDLV